MTPTPVPFPYERRHASLLGTLRRPVARVALHSAVFRRWIAYTVVVDTGADYCVFPASVALDLGIALRRCAQHAALGIGGPQKVFLYRALRLRLGSWELVVPVGFVEREDLPPLLGRSHCLDVFDLRLCRFVTTFSAPPASPLTS